MVNLSLSEWNERLPVTQKFPVYMSIIELCSCCLGPPRQGMTIGGGSINSSLLPRFHLASLCCSFCDAVSSLLCTLPGTSGLNIDCVDITVSAIDLLRARAQKISQDWKVTSSQDKYHSSKEENDQLRASRPRVPSARFPCSSFPLLLMNISL